MAQSTRSALPARSGGVAAGAAQARRRTAVDVLTIAQFGSGAAGDPARRADDRVVRPVGALRKAKENG